MKNVQFFFVIAFMIVLCNCKPKHENSIESDEFVKSSHEEDNIIEKLKAQIKNKEEELETAEKVNKNFERMIQLVNIMGQVDAFLTDRTKLVLKKLAMLADDFDGRDNKKYDINF